MRLLSLLRPLPRRLLPGPVRLGGLVPATVSAPRWTRSSPSRTSLPTSPGLDGAFEQAVFRTRRRPRTTRRARSRAAPTARLAAAFSQVVIHSADGAPLFAQVALHPARIPASSSCTGSTRTAMPRSIRWAALLYASGYDVIAADQRDFSTSRTTRKVGYPDWLQTFGWKESEDVLAAGRYLSAAAGRRRRSASSASAKARRTRCSRSRSTRHAGHGSSRPG